MIFTLIFYPSRNGAHVTATPGIRHIHAHGLSEAFRTLWSSSEVRECLRRTGMGPRKINQLIESLESGIPLWLPGVLVDEPLAQAVGLCWKA